MCTRFHTWLHCHRILYDSDPVRVEQLCGDVDAARGVKNRHADVIGHSGTENLRSDHDVCSANKNVQRRLK